MSRPARPRAGVVMLTLPFIASPRSEPVSERRLKPPRGVASALPRHELLEKIRTGLDGQLVILQAPPGFGKTELMLSALRLANEGDQFVWMTLDARDADPRRFLRDLARALEGGALGVLASETPDVETLMRAALGAMRTDQGRVVIFLDDIDAASGPEFNACFAQLLRYAPEDVSIVAAARRRPAFPLARLRMRGLLTEIQARDLAFTSRDCEALLREDASADEAGGLESQVSGWPALARLAAELSREARGAKDRREALAGSHPLFREYVIEEFLPELPPSLRVALGACAVLDEFPLALAVELAGIEFKPELALEIADFAPVIEFVPERAGWVRLNPVLLRVLRDRLLAEPPSALSALHLRASGWFAERGILDKAVHHAALGGDFVLAAEWIGKAGGVNIYLRLGYTVLERLLADLPSAIVDRSPALKLCRAVALSKQGEVQAARAVVDELKRAGARGDDPELRNPVFVTDLAHIDALIDCYEDRGLDEAGVAGLEREVRDDASQDRWRRGWNYNHLCIAYQRQGHLLLARRAGLRALASYRQLKSSYAQVFILAHLGAVLIRGGRVAAASKILRAARRLVAEKHGHDENLAAIVDIASAMAAYLQGEVAEAETSLTSAMPVVSRGEGWVDPFENGFVTLALARLRLQGFEAGLAVLDQAEELAVERDLPRLGLAIAVARVELLARSGLLESALDQMRLLPPLSSDPDRFAMNLEGWPTWRERQDALLTGARLQMLLGKPETAFEMLSYLVAEARERGAGLDVLAGEVRLTEALWAMDRREDALSSLQRSIALARPQDVAQPFLDAGPNYSKVVRAITRRFGMGVFSPDSATFIVRINGLGDRRPAETTAKPDRKVLSEREREVLSCVAADLSNKEIARKLNLSEVTVKFHLKNLFQKLGVGRRNLACAVATAAGLI